MDNINVWDTDSISNRKLRTALEAVHSILPMDIRQKFLDRVVSNFRQGRADCLPDDPPEGKHIEWWNAVYDALVRAKGEKYGG